MGRGEEQEYMKEEKAELNAAEIAANSMVEELEQELNDDTSTADIEQQDDATESNEIEEQCEQDETEQSTNEGAESEQDDEQSDEGEENVVDEEGDTEEEQQSEQAQENEAPDQDELSAIEKRKKRNENYKKGNNLLGFRRYRAGDLDPETTVYAMVIGPDQECRTDRDIKEVMNDRDLRGEIVPMRPLKPIKRGVKEVVGFS